MDRQLNSEQGILRIIESHGALAAHAIAAADVRRAAVAEATRARLLAEAGIGQGDAVPFPTGARRFFGHALISLGLRLQGPYRAARATAPAAST